jgi:hypothetical protein
MPDCNQDNCLMILEPIRNLQVSNIFKKLPLLLADPIGRTV